MKAITTILIMLMMAGMGTAIAQQTLEGIYSGRNAAGDHLAVNFKGDGTVDFVENGLKLTTIDYETYYNYTPNRVAVNYWANNQTIRVKAAIFEFVGQRLKFEYIDNDGSMFPAAFTISHYLLSPGYTDNPNQVQDTQRIINTGGADADVDTDTRDSERKQDIQQPKKEQ